MDLFGTAGIRGRVEDEVTPALALAVGQAAGRDGDEFVVGRDGRETGQGLQSAVVAGLVAAGADVRTVGQVPTPTLAFASRGRRGVMVTASHNPPEDNGLKLFVDGEEYDREAEERIEDRVGDGIGAPSSQNGQEASGPTDWDSWGSVSSVDPLPDYREAVADYAGDYGADPGDLAVVVDCGTGVGGLATPQVLTTLGARVHALNANVDGRFPARDSKPTPETLTETASYVAGSDVDLGFAHDGDADRIVVFDADGDIVHEDTVLAIVAGRLVERSDAMDPVVVTTPNASGRIDEHVQDRGGRVERVRLGALHEGVARVEAGDGGTVVFAAEPWKHVHPALGPWIDGVATAALFARLVAAEGLDRLREPITERPYRKRSLPCPDEKKAAVMDRLEGKLPETYPDATVDTDHGLRLTFPDAGWVLVRPSGTEAYVRLYAESEDVEDLVETVAAEIEAAVEAV